MKALKIDPAGWAFKIAVFGGFPEDGVARDKGISKRNELLSKLYNTTDMSYDEFHSRKKDEYRAANFCEFSRAIVWGIIVAAAIALLVSTVSFVFVLGTVADIVWIVERFLYGAFYKVTWMEVMGFTVWSVVLFFGACMLAEYWSKQARLNRAETSSIDEAAILEEKIRKKELRQAFWGAIRNKTCFKVELK